MFDKLKKAFSKAAKGIAQKELTEKVLDDVLLDFQISLLESDVAQEVVDDLFAKLKKELLGLKLEKEQEATEIVQSKLRTAVAEIFERPGSFDLIEKIKAEKRAKSGPFVIVFLGINGTGKTTTVAKIANLLRKAGFSVVVAAGDTHRAGAIEQLEQHTNRLSLKIVKQRYGADPSSVGRDAYDHAKKNHIDIVLMDTAGRMQTSKNLMDEMGKIVRVVKPDVKLFIGDALAGNDTINQAREFFHYTNFDGAILTKVDADAKGGSAISIAHITSRPIVYIGMGQGYDDITPFDSNKFINSLFEGGAQVGESIEHVTSVQKISEITVENAKSENPQTVREEEKKDTVLLPKPPIGISSPMDQLVPSQRHQEAKEIAPKAIVDRYEASEIKEQPKEKKSRFGFFGKKRTEPDRSKEEGDNKQKPKLEDKWTEEQNERTRLKEEEEEEEEEEPNERQRNVLEDEENTKAEEEEGQQQNQDKVIYLTDEDIEDLLK
jgi:fused signal recognition particle receptor